jgi:hypothetical protein
VHAQTAPPFVYPPEIVWNNESGYQNVYEGGWDIELLGVVGNALNISLVFQVGEEKEYFKGSPGICIGGIDKLLSAKSDLREPTRSYLTEKICLVHVMFSKISKVETFLPHILCSPVDILCFVICLGCTYSPLHFQLRTQIELARFQFLQQHFQCHIQYYSHLTVSVCMHTTVLCTATCVLLLLGVLQCSDQHIVPGLPNHIPYQTGVHETYQNSRTNVKLRKGIWFVTWHVNFFSDTSESLNSEILENAVRSPDEDTCFKWAAVYQNFSTILDDMLVEKFRAIGKWSNENNMPLLCALEDGVVRTYGFVFLVRNGRNFLQPINDIIDRVVEGGIFMHIQKQAFCKHKTELKFNSLTFADTYTAISISHLQTVFYLLLLGYMLALASFVTEIMWHRCRSKRHEPNSTSLCQERT